MKHLVIRFLKAIGLVPAGRHTIVVQQLRTSEQRVKKLAGELESLRRLEARNTQLSKLVGETRDQAREWKRQVEAASSSSRRRCS